MQYCRDHHPWTADTVQCCAVVPGTCHVRENHALERLFQQHLDTETSESQLAKRLATMFLMCRRHAGRALVAQLSTTLEAAARRSYPPSSSQTNESHDVGRSRDRRQRKKIPGGSRGVPQRGSGGVLGESPHQKLPLQSPLGGGINSSCTLHAIIKVLRARRAPEGTPATNTPL